MRALTILLLSAVIASFMFSLGCKGAQRTDDQLLGFNTKDWVKIGERRVRLKAEKDVIPVTFLKGTFSLLVFRKELVWL